MQKFIILFSLLVLCSCTKNEEEKIVMDFLDCDEISADYKSYQGEEISCEFYYSLTEYNNQNYIELEAPCADLSRPFVFNDQCIDICENEPFEEDSECARYLRNRKMMNIILIEK